jgi:hypothetical protein
MFFRSIYNVLPHLHKYPCCTKPSVVYKPLVKDAELITIMPHKAAANFLPSAPLSQKPPTTTNKTTKGSVQPGLHHVPLGMTKPYLLYAVFSSMASLFCLF